MRDIIVKRITNNNKVYLVINEWGMDNNTNISPHLYLFCQFIKEKMDVVAPSITKVFFAEEL